MLLAPLFSGEASGQGQTSVVAVVPARQQAVASTIDLVGSVRPYTRSVIAGEVSGVVEALPAEEGDRLDKGEVICRLRRRTRELALKAETATLGRVAEQLAELEAGTRKEELARAKAEMEEARALHGKWLKELDRVTGLRKEGSAGQKEYNDAVAETAAARERLAQTEAVYELAVAGPRAEQITQAKLAVEAQRSVVARQQYDLDQCTIRAPFAGYVTRKHTEVGQWLAAGGAVVELIDIEHVLVRVDVPESAIGGARKGQTACVVVGALGKTFRGVVKHVIPQADEKARTFPVELEVDNPDNELKSGMFTRVNLPAGPTIESVIVPRDAILQRGPMHFVVIVGPPPPPAEPKGEFAMPVPVQLGADVGVWVAVQSPMVQPGVRVAVKGHDRIYVPGPTISRPAKVPDPPKVSGIPTSQPTSGPAPG